jgi:anti-sigma factor RsiW
MNTDCPNATMRDRLPDLLHDGLSASARAETERHLAECPSCAEELALLRAARRALAIAPSVDVARIAAAIGRPPAVPVAIGSDPRVVSIGTAPSLGRVAAPRAPRRLPTAWRVAAGIALVAAGALGSGLALGTKQQPGEVHSPAADPTLAVALAVGAAPVAGTTPGGPAEGPAREGGRSELRMGGGLHDLSDQDLSTLLGAIRGVQTLPETEPEPVMTLSDGDVR